MPVSTVHPPMLLEKLLVPTLKLFPSILTEFTDGGRRMPLVISFTTDQTAAIHEITFLAVKHDRVSVRIERSKSRDEDSIWNQWLMTDNVYRSIRIDV